MEDANNGTTLEEEGHGNSKWLEVASATTAYGE